MLGINTFCLRKAIANDVSEVIRQLHEMGCEMVEPFVISEEALGAIKAEADKWGMTIPSVHLDFGGSSIAPDAEEMLPKLQSMHKKYGVDTFVISGLFTDAAGAKQWAVLCRNLAAALKADGCRVLYHNHDYEIREIHADGEVLPALDIFFRYTGPDVLLQLDIGWAGMAGNEVAVAKRYADRIWSLHLKDFFPGYRGKYECRTIPQEGFCAIGTGDVRHREVLALRDQMPNFCGTLILDQDKSSGDLMDDLRTGIRNVTAWL